MFIKKLSQIVLIAVSATLMTSCIGRAPANYIGDLGGLPVELPRNIVTFVAYNGDPTFGKKREGKKPTRSYESEINSFGFDLRYTDNTIFDKSNKSHKYAYDKEQYLPNDPWVSVRVSSGDKYHGVGAIHRIGDGTISANGVDPVYTYEQLDNDQYGLEFYAPPGIDPKTDRPYREDRYAEDVFIQRDKNSQITTYIRCSNRDVPRPPCIHNFDLEPEMALYVNVQYSRHNITDWQQIEQVVRQQILNFRKVS
ncbi:hypothetical protein [Psychrobacter fjordensis]|uniref:hypothetical protein n=1 Tax=Psychrobacter fjordensis TaxID=664424 RepID=UPI001D11EA16|nr:hypothetical protein [Psychrobacter fjordensis]